MRLAGGSDAGGLRLAGDGETGDRFALWVGLWEGWLLPRSDAMPHLRRASSSAVVARLAIAVGLLAAVAVLPLLVPPSAVAWDLLPLEDRLALEATEISAAKICGASECTEVSDPEEIGRAHV